jgi:hypothetical protein
MVALKGDLRVEFSHLNCEEAITALKRATATIGGEDKDEYPMCA